MLLIVFSMRHVCCTLHILSRHTVSQRPFTETIHRDIATKMTLLASNYVN